MPLYSFWLYARQPFWWPCILLTKLPALQGFFYILCVARIWSSMLINDVSSSLKKTINSNGPSMQPWGTPAFASMSLALCLWPGPLYQTLSKTVDMSRKTIQTSLPLSSALYILSTIFINWYMALSHSLNPEFLAIKKGLERNSSNLLFTLLSLTVDKLERSEIGL